MNETIKISERERKALLVLARFFNHDANCIFFRTVAKYSGLDEVQSRKAVRSLARKGLAQYERGLFDDDGFVAGSGYSCTRAGYEMVKAELPNEDEDWL